MATKRRGPFDLYARTREGSRADAFLQHAMCEANALDLLGNGAVGFIAADTIHFMKLSGLVVARSNNRRQSVEPMRPAWQTEWGEPYHIHICSRKRLGLVKIGVCDPQIVLLPAMAQRTQKQEPIDATDSRCLRVAQSMDVTTLLKWNS